MANLIIKPTSGGSLVLQDEGGDAALTVGTTGIVTIPAWIPPAGAVVQVVNTQTGAVATGTTTMPEDDTIPQITEGTEFMTLAITPTSATNKLFIQIKYAWSFTANDDMISALFQDSTAGALAAMQNTTGLADRRNNSSFNHFMTAGTTSATTFKFRMGGGSSGTVTFNGISSGRLGGGVSASSMTIMEIQV